MEEHRLQLALEDDKKTLKRERAEISTSLKMALTVALALFILICVLLGGSGVMVRQDER